MITETESIAGTIYISKDAILLETAGTTEIEMIKVDIEVLAVIGTCIIKRSYLRFPATVSACDDWFSARVMHESVLSLNLYVPKLCAEQICSTHVYHNVTHRLIYNKGQ